MEKNKYDIFLLQETNVNRNCVFAAEGYKFFFSTDVKEQEVANTISGTRKPLPKVRAELVYREPM